MPYSGVNQWGPYTSAATDDDLPQYPPSATPTAPGPQAQSPTGVITGLQTVPNGPSSRMSPAAFNFNESESSTEAFLDQFGVPAGTPADDGAFMTATALTSPVQIQGLSPVAISQNAWCSGAVAPVIS